MKINELTGIKKFPKLPKSKEDVIGDDRKLYDSIRNLLKEKGFKYLSEGAYGITFKGKNSVLKVFKNDLAYEHYISLLKSVPNEYKQFVPKTTSVRSYPKNPDIKFVKLEFLKENNLTNEKYDFRDFNKLLSITNKKFINHEQLLPYIEPRTSQQEYLLKFSIDFINFVIWLRNNMSEFYFDLGNQNIMMRGNTPVIIDPFV